MLRHRANSSFKKFFCKTYRLATIHLLLTEKQSDRQRDDNSYHKLDRYLSTIG